MIHDLALALGCLVVGVILVAISLFGIVSRIDLGLDSINIHEGLLDD